MPIKNICHKLGETKVNVFTSVKYTPSKIDHISNEILIAFAVSIFHIDEKTIKIIAFTGIA